MRFRLDTRPLTPMTDRLMRGDSTEDAISTIAIGRTAHDALLRFTRTDEAMVIATVTEMNDELVATVRREDRWYEIQLRAE